MRRYLSTSFFEAIEYSRRVMVSCEGCKTKEAIQHLSHPYERQCQHENGERKGLKGPVPKQGHLHHLSRIEDGSLTLSLSILSALLLDRARCCCCLCTIAVLGGVCFDSDKVGEAAVAGAPAARLEIDRAEHRAAEGSERAAERDSSSDIVARLESTIGSAEDKEGDLLDPDQLVCTDSTGIRRMTRVRRSRTRGSAKVRLQPCAALRFSPSLLARNPDSLLCVNLLRTPTEPSQRYQDKEIRQRYRPDPRRAETPGGRSTENPADRHHGTRARV